MLLKCEMGRIQVLMSVMAVLGLTSETAHADAVRNYTQKSIRLIEDNFVAYMPTEWSATSIQLDQEVDRSLTAHGLTSPKDHTPLDLLQFQADGGDIVKISVRSEEFDPLVWVAGINGRVLISSDDDGGDGPDAELTTVLPRNGNYLLAVNSYGESGSYRVQVDRLPALSIPERSAKSNKRAVLLGINDYLGVNYDLSAPVHDVDAMRNLLSTHGGFRESDILVLKNGHVTRKNIYGAIRKFFASVSPQGTIIFYYSGHGIQLDQDRDLNEKRHSQEDNGNERDAMDEALFLADGSYIIDHELRELLTCNEAKRATVIVDACFSGGIDRGGGKKVVPVEEVREYINLAEDSDHRLHEACANSHRSSEREVDVILSASQEDEIAWEWSDWETLSIPRSVFTYYFVDRFSHALEGGFTVSAESISSDISLLTTSFTQEWKHSIQEASFVNHLRRSPFVHELFGLP